MVAMVPRLLLMSLLVLCAIPVSFAQDQEKSSGPRTELLTIDGGKPNLSATDDRITSYKANGVYHRGKTTINAMKISQMPFKIELPSGYTLFGDTLYAVETKAGFSGTGAITFNLPSAKTKATFDQLRILYPMANADPDSPKWVDVTFDEVSPMKDLLTDPAIKARLPDFDSRTLHAFIESQQFVFVVALRDPTKVRDKLTVDLELTGTGTEQLTEGRSGQYELKLTNGGPHAATHIVLAGNTGYMGFSFVSVEANGGKCRAFESRFYCKFPSLEKAGSIDVKIVARSEFTQQSRDSKPGERSENGQVGMVLTVTSTEQDLAAENNRLDLTTSIYWDPNKGPIIEAVSPTLFQVFASPASIPISFKASDPDGFVKKVEVFEERQLLGPATMKSEGEYELVLQTVSPGRHHVTVVATDNLGRTSSQELPEFFVNGPARVEITSPKPGSIVSRADGEITVTIRATSASSSLKKVALDRWDYEATPIGNDNYVVKVKSCVRKCRLQAIAIDNKGNESRSEYVEFIVASTPITTMYWHDGEYLREFEAGKPLKVQNGLKLHASAGHEDSFIEADIVKTQIFVDGVLVCTTDEATRFWYEFNCVWRPSPGKYKLHAIATDVDGMAGKSEVIEVVIERP